MIELDPSVHTLNIGCGAFKKPGAINVDIDSRFGPEVVHDLDRLPYPFASERFETIEASHVLEHLQNPLAVVGELHRILKPGGRLVVRVPHFSRGFSHPDHKRGFDITFPMYFDPNQPAIYVGPTFELEFMRLRWFAQPDFKRRVLSGVQFHSGRAAGAVIDFLANLSPALCARGWCYLVGGFEEIEMRLRKA